jgi:putative transposase
MGCSLDFKKRVIKYIEEGASKRAASKVFDVSETSIYRWIKQAKTGDLKYKKPNRPWRKIDPSRLIKLVEENPSAKQEDYAKILNVSKSAIGWAFKSLKITRKKSPRYIKNETNINEKYFWKISKE